MKRIILWGVLLLGMFSVTANAKDKYYIDIDLVNGSKDMQSNIAFFNKNITGVEYNDFEDGYLYLQKENKNVLASDKNIRFEIPEKLINSDFKLVFNNKNGVFQTGGFKCQFVKENNTNNVCYQVFDFDAGLLKNFTNFNVLKNTFTNFKSDILNIIICIVSLISIAIIYNKFMIVNGCKKSIVNADIFYILVFSIIVFLARTTYTINIFNFPSFNVCATLFIIPYYFIYYFTKYMTVRKKGNLTIAYTLLAFTLASLISILAFLK